MDITVRYVISAMLVVDIELLLPDLILVRSEYWRQRG